MTKGTGAWRFAVDRGGTFTDVVAVTPAGRLVTDKLLSESPGQYDDAASEAVRRLSSEYAILIKDNRRLTVPLMTPERFEELVALRIAVETHAALRALPYISDIVIDRLTEIDGSMDRFVAEKNADQLTLLNQAFHRMLYSVNPAQASLPMIESIWLQLGPFQRQVITEVAEYYQIDRHKEVLAALTARDGAALSAAIANDIVDGVLDTGRKLLAAEAGRERGLP